MQKKEFRLLLKKRKKSISDCISLYSNVEYTLKKQI